MGEEKWLKSAQSTVVTGRTGTTGHCADVSPSQVFLI